MFVNVTQISYRLSAYFYAAGIFGGRLKRAVLQELVCRLEEKNVVNGKKTSTTPSRSGPIQAQKSRGNSILGVVFSHPMPKMDFHYSHRFSLEKKHTKLIYHMPWLYQYPPLPFHRSYKN